MTDEMPPNETASLPSLQSQTGGNMSVTADGRAIVTPSASDGQAQRDSICMFLTSDDELLTRRVEETHVPNSSVIDVRPLFQLIEDIIARSIPTVFPAVPDDQVPKETIMIEVRDSLTAIVTIPDLPHIIDKIFCEMKCKSSVGNSAHDATISMLKSLAHFSWEAKVVLTLAAFTLTYGEFWLLAQIYSTNPLAKLMARLKQLRQIMESRSFEHQFDVVNKLIKAILNMTGFIVKFKDLLSNKEMEEEPKFKAKSHYIIPFAAYWTIKYTMRAMAHLTTLTSRGHEYLPSTAEMLKMSNWEYKLTTMYEHFMSEMRRLKEYIEKKKEYEAYETLRKFINQMNHIDNISVLTRLIADSLPLYDCSSERQVQLEVLRGKNVLLLISDLNISKAELSMLKRIYNDTKLQQYEVVWIPIVDRSIQWSHVQARFEGLLGLMPWYSVYQPSKLDTAVIKFVRDDWNFMGKPILVVLDPQGKVVNPNAIHMMWIWGSPAFPFTSKKEEELWMGGSWKLELLVDAICIHDQRISDWIRDGKYILMHGGDDIEWIRKFTSQARTVAASARIELEMVYAGTSHAKRNAISRVRADLMSENLSLCWNDPTTVRFFWQRIQSMLLSKIQLEQVDNHSDIITQEIKKLLSNERSPGGWALLAQGSRVVLHGQASTFHTVLSQFEEWKNEMVNSDFASVIQIHMRKIEIPELCTVPELTSDPLP